MSTDAAAEDLVVVAAPGPDGWDELGSALRARGCALAAIGSPIAPSDAGAAAALLGGATPARTLFVDPRGADTPTVLAWVDALRAASDHARGCTAFAIRPARTRMARWGRGWAATGLWLAGGVWLPDPASPAVLVPREVYERVRPAFGSVAWRAEALVRTAWQGTAVVLCPAVPGGPDRAAWPRFHLLLAWPIARLVLRRLWPWGRGPGDLRRLRALFGAHLSPGRASAACALGAAMAVAPVPGLQMAIAAAFAIKLGLNVPLTLMVSNISLGPLLAMWYAAAIALGMELLDHRPLEQVFLAMHRELLAAHGLASLGHALRGCLWAWLLGSSLLMAALGVLGALGGYLAARWCQRA